MRCLYALRASFCFTDDQRKIVATDPLFLFDLCPVVDGPELCADHNDVDTGRNSNM